MFRLWFRQSLFFDKVQVDIHMGNVRSNSLRSMTQSAARNLTSRVVQQPCHRCDPHTQKVRMLLHISKLVFGLRLPRFGCGGCIWLEKHWTLWISWFYGDLASELVKLAIRDIFNSQLTSWRRASLQPSPLLIPSNGQNSKIVNTSRTHKNTRKWGKSSLFWTIFKQFTKSS